MSDVPAVILSVAGSDCSAGAGIQADLKSIAAMGGYGLTAITAVVSEAPGKVSRIELMPHTLIGDQVRVLDAAFPIAAAKTGMLGGLDQTIATVEALTPLRQRGVPIVCDPVMVATSGDSLLNEEASYALQKWLLPLATLITPNMDEATQLWGEKVRSRKAMQACAEELAEGYGTAVLVKGGHLKGAVAADCLVHAGGTLWLELPRTQGVSTHGTGCSYSAAIATGLGQGLILEDAVSRAKEFVARAIAQHHVWNTSAGPTHALHHFAR
jgi:hydroxymethylpyrimidine/phosphomethylpyrimidine kinase